MKRRSSETPKIQTGQWLTTYADLMNNLLVFFMLLYIMSVIDLQKFKQITTSFAETFLGAVQVSSVNAPGENANTEFVIVNPEATATPEATPSETPEVSPTVTPDITPSPNPDSEQEYDELFSRINLLLEEKGYVDQVSVEKKSDIIYLRFREGVFFYPDSPELKSNAYTILKNISDIILESYDLIEGIDISGHTAKVRNDPPTKYNLFSWELSTDRALTVLRYLVQQCDMPQEKLSVTGYSCNDLYVEGDTEELMAQNRRVEIRLSRKKDDD